MSSTVGPQGASSSSYSQHADWHPALPALARTTTSEGLPTRSPDASLGFAQAEAAASVGDPLARFTATHGLHADVQHFAHASPGSSGGADSPAREPAAKTQAPANDDAANGTALKVAKALMDHGLKMLKQHRYSEALAAFQEGFRTYPDRAFILNEASTLFEAGRYAEAVHAFERYLSDPEAPRADEARATMERARAALGGREPTMSDIVESRRLFAAGAKAFQEGRYEEALVAFTAAHEKNPLADLEFNRAACLEKLGRPYAAADRYQAYVAAKPDAADAAKVKERVDKLRSEADVRPINATGVAGGQEWMSRGNRLLVEGRHDEAVAAFQEGFRTYPDSKFILNEAAALLDGGRHAEADLAYQRYLSDPNAPRADEARAAQERARAHLGGREATITGVAQAGQYFDKAAALYKDGRYAEALEAFERAYALSPSPQLRFNQAACLERLGRREEAAQRYDEYVAARPRAADAAKVQSHARELHAQAATLARQAFDRAQTAFQEGRFGDAAVAFGEAHGHLPRPEFLFNGAKALDRAGDTAKAVREYQRYLNARPDAPDADNVRVRIHELQRMTSSDLMRP